MLSVITARAGNWVITDIAATKNNVLADTKIIDFFFIVFSNQICINY